jgi:RNA polymerase sigma-70 factor (ECF subfamily)
MINTKKEQVFNEVFRENRDKIFKLCYSYLDKKENAEDLFQEVMMNVWMNLDKFRGESRISTWIYRIAINTALLYNKKDSRINKVKMQNGNPENIRETESYDESMEKEKKIILHYESISKLSKQNRLIITLALEGLSYADISEIVGITVSNVGVRINRIKDELFKIMKGDLQ